MNQQETRLGSDWVDIKALFSLEDGVLYTVQATGNAAVNICEYDAVPPDNVNGQLLSGGTGDDWATVRPKDGFNIYVRSARSVSSRISVSEAA